MSPASKRTFALVCIAVLIARVASACMAVECQHETDTALDRLYGFICAALFVIVVGHPSDNESNNH